MNTTFEKVFSEKEKLCSNSIRGLQPTKGVIEFVEKLKQENIKLGTASSSHKRLTKYVMEKLNILDLFDSAVSSEDVTCGEKSPGTFMRAANELDVNPPDCLAIEDSRGDLVTAKNGSMKCVGYMNPNIGDQDLSNADVVIDKFSALNLRQLLFQSVFCVVKFIEFCCKPFKFFGELCI